MIQKSHSLNLAAAALAAFTISAKADPAPTRAAPVYGSLKPNVVHTHQWMGLASVLVTPKGNTVSAIADIALGVVCEEVPKADGKKDEMSIGCVSASVPGTWGVGWAQARKGRERIDVKSWKDKPRIREESTITDTKSGLLVKAFRNWDLSKQQACLATVEGYKKRNHFVGVSAKYWGCVPFSPDNPYYNNLLQTSGFHPV